MIALLTLGGCAVAIGLGLFFNVYVGVAAGVVIGILIQGYSRYQKNIARQEEEKAARLAAQRKRREERRQKKEQNQAAMARSVEEKKQSYKKKERTLKTSVPVTILSEADAKEGSAETLAEKGE